MIPYQFISQNISTKLSICCRYVVVLDPFACQFLIDLPGFLPGIFSHRFFRCFFMENGSQIGDFGDHFCDFLMTFFGLRAKIVPGSILVTFLAPFWTPFGSLWTPFGSLWFPFGSLWAPFGSLWLTFGSLFAPFGSHFWSLWLTLCSFWFTFTQFSHFGCLLASFLVPFRFFERKSDEKKCFLHVFL